MKVPLAWLKEYLPTAHSVEQIADTLTAIGLEFEGAHDGVMEIALTPNLIHCAHIRGIARELAAVTGETLCLPKYASIENARELVQKHVSVSVENTASCPRYTCRLITGVKIAPSPSWLKERIEQCGMRSVNNVVDITNLVLLELGHPLHAFDFDKLEGKQIVVRNARKGETLVTLDGKKHYPTEETLLICDAKKPVAIAGIMGSLESEVSDTTTAVLLESAYFEPSQVRRSSKRMEIRSEASYHFERGCDPNGPLEALERATAWICEIAGGTALQGHLDVKAKEFAPPLVKCRLSRINQVLGTRLAMSEVEVIFRRLGFLIDHVGDDQIALKIPTYRVDIHQEIDLVEEVARLYGYDAIHRRERALYRTGTLPHSPEYLFTRKIRCALLKEGLQECSTCDLISPTEAALISTDTFPTRALIKLLNPHSIEQSVMRPSLLPGMLSVIRYNEDHGIEAVSGFEVGRVHFTAKDKYLEPPVAAIVLAGEKAPYHWETKSRPVDFFDLKGIVENLLEGLKITSFSFAPSGYANFHPGRQATLMIGDVEAGILGEVHPLTLGQAGLKRPVYYAEINLHDLQPFIPGEIRMEPLPQFPASSRDWTATVAEEVPVGTLLERVLSTPSELLESVALQDIYRSSTLGPFLKNVTFRFVYRDRHKT
ncbi:phenylalanine--tRNA ligase subunit beta, partial [Chlamydiota bacterium]